MLARTPASLAIAAALISSFADKPISSDTVAFGEIALSGEVRPVAHSALRCREAAKLGFARAMAPSSVEDGKGMRISGIKSAAALVEHMMGKTD